MAPDSTIFYPEISKSGMQVDKRVIHRSPFRRIESKVSTRLPPPRRNDTEAKRASRVRHPRFQAKLYSTSSVSWLSSLEQPHESHMTNFHLYYGLRSHLAKNLDLEQLSIPLSLQKGEGEISCSRRPSKASLPTPRSVQERVENTPSTPMSHRIGWYGKK